MSEPENRESRAHPCTDAASAHAATRSVPGVRRPGVYAENVSPLRPNTLSGDGKLASGAPRIGLDSPDVSGDRRTVASAISLNYGVPRHGLEPGRLRSNEPMAWERTAPAEGRSLSAKEGEEARHAASARSSAISLNYGTLGRDLELARLRSVKSLTFIGAAPAKGRPLLTREREKARHATSAPSSVISLNYASPKKRENNGPEPGGFRPSGHTTSGRATPAAKRPLLAEKRGDARYAASALSRQSSKNPQPMDGPRRQ